MNKVIGNLPLPKIWVNGNQLARKITNEISGRMEAERVGNVQFYKRNTGWSKPNLHIINVGLDDASLSYIKKKMDMASSIGVCFSLHQFLYNRIDQERNHKAFNYIRKSAVSNNFSIKVFKLPYPRSCFQQIEGLIDELNGRKDVSGIVVQLPLRPFTKDFTTDLINKIDPLKDVDCLTLINRAKVIDHDKPELMPCIHSCVLRILDQYGVDVRGKRAVVVGKNELVWLPLSHLLVNRNATIDFCHVKAGDLNEVTGSADIVLSAAGKPNLITNVKRGAIAIDIGISRDCNGKLCGDIEENVKRECALATPVPGGVGPLTVAMLLGNTVNMWRRQMESIRTFERE